MASFNCYHRDECVPFEVVEFVGLRDFVTQVVCVSCLELDQHFGVR